MTQYAFWDTRGNGHWVVNGVAQAANTEIDVSAANLSQVSYVFGPGGSTPDTLYVRANDGSKWSSWAAFTATPGVDTAPVVTAANVAAVHGQASAARLEPVLDLGCRERSDHPVRVLGHRGQRPLGGEWCRPGRQRRDRCVRGEPVAGQLRVRSRQLDARHALRAGERRIEVEHLDRIHGNTGPRHGSGRDGGERGRGPR